MIYSLTGKVTETLSDSIIVDVSGIGYQVFVPATALTSNLLTEDQVKIIIYHHIREDQQTLYGFLSATDRQLFTLLTTVSGVGPKVALKLLSVCSPNQFIQAVLQGDLALITQTPGVGKKLAEKVILELKDKLSKLAPEHLPTPSSSSVKIIDQALERDLALALKSLGYSNDEAKRSIEKASDQLKENMSLEDGLKQLLKHL